jgi:hypothetical protein
MAKTSTPMTASCRCGQVGFAIRGAPIMHVACYCTSCRTAGHGFEHALGAPPIVADDGGTDLVLYRKDRVTLTVGVDRLSHHRLKPGSPTRRGVAICCNTPMLAEFTPGHWLSFYRSALPKDLVPLEMRVMIEDKVADVPLPQGVPAYATRPGRFMGKLIAAWAAMGFRRPQVAW